MAKKKPYDRLNPGKPKNNLPRMPRDDKYADLIRGKSPGGSFVRKPKK